MTDLSALASLSPAELEAVKALGANQGTQNPNQLPGKPQVWKVGNKTYAVYYIPGTSTPMVWEATNAEMAEAFGGIGSPGPSVDKTMSEAEFQALSPWLAGRISELRNTAEDPWTQFFSDFNESADLRPWLRDPDMLATIATAYLEGRTPTADELSQTDWWQDHTAAERQWLEESVTLGREEIQSRRDDTRRAITDRLLEMGATRIGQAAISLLTNKVLTGEWSESYAAEQIAKIADPYSKGTLDPALASVLSDEMTQTRGEEDRVRQMAVQWLGPVAGNLSQQEVEKWAGWMRNDPDAEINFTNHLQQIRMSMFPNYTNQNLTYEDIVSPFRNLAQNTWGQPIRDETMLIDLANLGDYTEASKRLRKAGLDQGVQKVVNDALGDLGQTGLGDRVVSSTI